ncbi:MAG: hypothetical protein A2351_00370 [Omnitrophica bacterium RIFOXYB12_FULL_50_7]|nr:MAG: hypothetical protein A2351_00370 [Omnitrophica bacterium RIFOXYB12_FULL_50_7]
MKKEDLCKILRGRRAQMVVTMAVVIAWGLVSKRYSGPGRFWVNNSFAGVFYEIFWCLFFSFWLPKARPWVIALWVLGVTCGLEVSQLWHPAFLRPVRANFWGAALIGTTFVGSDFFYYVVGCGIGLLWSTLFKKSENDSSGKAK